MEILYVVIFFFFWIVLPNMLETDADRESRKNARTYSGAVGTNPYRPDYPQG